MGRSVIVLAALALMLLVDARSASARKIETGFLDRTVSAQATTYRYQVFVPANFDPTGNGP